jgi:transcriptional regulator with XRE-family HTH domain
MGQTRPIAPTPLAVFVRERLAELDISQSDFCRRSTFDQGLLSKIQNSLVTSLSIESVLKLAVGLSVQPQQLFQLIDRMDLHELVIQSYTQEFTAVVNDWMRSESPDLAAEVQRVIADAAAAAKPPVIRPRRRRWAKESANGVEAQNGTNEEEVKVQM